MLTRCDDHVTLEFHEGKKYNVNCLIHPIANVVKCIFSILLQMVCHKFSLLSKTVIAHKKVCVWAESSKLIDRWDHAMIEEQWW